MMEKGFAWFPSHARAARLDIEPVFIYHVPRTGTTTLFSVLRNAFETVFAVLKDADSGVSLPGIGRFDDKNPADAIAAATRRFCLAASHKGFGFHERFPQPFQFVAVLRDPVQTVMSRYTYERMRAGKPPGIDGLAEFIDSPQFRNVATRQLAGMPMTERPQANQDHFEMAVRNLENHFRIFGPTICLADIGS
ncbi:MAG: hypothetical protein MI741_13065, partial [Rhodospirillales bacterium]|nr:hypothetical protein [Rhodospirillales bacterium]